MIGLDASEAILASAKTGLGTAEVLEAIVKRVPPRKASRTGAAAQIFDSHFDA